ncbi:thyrotroph embryonic factor isoform X2 [Eurytemora carolleeae]|uniref:thyrotroph embryonic factor isoform X1 n=1 Tax=Eurytemora carolleeae TaxID=1294199 RepID=UPI000C77305D|nr:thyrotroph embryonic factor isoform X1 [Eurytemora carolleeae]XP_023336300.1 thyrotroph embryonic factor isoform X2 [Eurytemora carolleeae]|eukprot:XP_023336299.1 thyrotroph embryonic factor-like isoform X1 [Eurytemora affinis]
MDGMSWTGPRMSIRDLLEKVDLFNVAVEDSTKEQNTGEALNKNMEKNREGKTVIKVSDPTSAYLGPKLWDKQITLDLDFEDIKENEVMNMEDFLAENNITLDQERSNSDTDEPLEVALASDSLWRTLEDMETESKMLDDTEAIDMKPVLKSCGVIVKKQVSKEDKKPALPKGDNGFLYAESKRAKMEREKEERKRKLEVEMDFPAEDLALATIPGVNFNPRERAFDMEELRPQPIIRKRQKSFVPDEAKDDKYWENRIKNNIAARRSREARRLKENQIALRAAYLEKENKLLKKELDDVYFLNSRVAAEKKILLLKLAKYEK